MSAESSNSNTNLVQSAVFWFNCATSQVLKWELARDEFIEPTVAGTAMALVALNVVQLDQVSQRAKIIHITATNVLIVSSYIYS